MSTTLLSQLSQATISTFEDLGFVVPSPEVDEHQAAIPLAWRARVRFSGPVEGWLEIRISDRSAHELATNMLGGQEALDPAVKRDAIGEIANVICGNVVPALGTPTDVFDLQAPELSDIHPGSPKADDEGFVLEMGLDGGRAELELCVERVGTFVGEPA